jgi:hypothetical protein
VRARRRCRNVAWSAVRDALALAANTNNKISFAPPIVITRPREMPFSAVGTGLLY